MHPTRSRGIKRSSEPCFKKTLPAVCCGLIPIPSSVMMAVVAGSTLNSSAANFTTAVNGMLPKTLKLWNKTMNKKNSYEKWSLSIDRCGLLVDWYLVDCKLFYSQFSAICVSTQSNINRLINLTAIWASSPVIRQRKIIKYFHLHFKRQLWIWC